MLPEVAVRVMSGDMAGMQRKAMRARIAARADTEAPTAMYSDAPAGMPTHSCVVKTILTEREHSWSPSTPKCQVFHS